MRVQARSIEELLPADQIVPAERTGALPARALLCELQRHVDLRDVLVTSDLSIALTQAVRNFAELVPFAYSAQTAFPDVPSDRKGALNANGQCAVAERLLQDEIQTIVAGMGYHCINALGKIEGSASQTLAGYHEWIELHRSASDPDPYIIDITPRQDYALGPQAPAYILGRQSELAARGYCYVRDRFDTDDDLRDPQLQSKARTWERYLRLKKRYERVKAQEEKLRRLFSDTFFVLLPADYAEAQAAIQELKETVPHRIIFADDFYKLLALFASWVGDANDWGNLSNLVAIMDQDGSDCLDNASMMHPFEDWVPKPNGKHIIAQTLIDQTAALSELVRHTETVYPAGGGVYIVVNGNRIRTDFLSDPDIAVIANFIRTKTRAGELFAAFVRAKAQAEHAAIVVSSTAREHADIQYLDTTRLKLVCLETDGKNRHVRVKLNYQPTEHTQRSNTWLIQALRPMHRADDVEQDRLLYQREHECERTGWTWESNPILTKAWEVAHEHFSPQLEAMALYGIAELDVFLQVLMLLSSYDTCEIWRNGSVDTLKQVCEALQNNIGAKANRLFEEYLASGGQLNLELVTRVFDQAIEFLKSIQSEPAIEPYARAIQVLNHPSHRPFESIPLGIGAKTVAVSVDQLSSRQRRQIQYILSPVDDATESTVSINDPNIIIYGVVPESGSPPVDQIHDFVVITEIGPRINHVMARALHYLHSNGRQGPYERAYGAFAGGLLPIAWLTFDRVDRDYKAAMYRKLSIPAHQLREIPRGWNSCGAPGNMMSSLLGAAITCERKHWQEEIKLGLRPDLPLLGWGTVINQNVGFSASWLRGGQFLPVGLRPAGHTFLRGEGDIRIPMIRRHLMDELGVHTLAELRRHPAYLTNQVPLLPLVEMLRLDEGKLKKFVMQRPLYAIPPDDMDK